MLQNDILINLTTLLISKKFEIEWTLVYQFSKCVIRHCVHLNFDSHSKQLLLLNSLYLLVRLSYENYIGEALSEQIYGQKEPTAAIFSFDKGSFIYGFLMEGWFSDLFLTSEAPKTVLQIDLILVMCSSLMLFIENIHQESEFDKKSRVVISVFERISIEARDFSFKILSHLFRQVDFNLS